MRRHSSSYKLRKQTDLTAKVHAKALDLKLIEETSRPDLERACEAAHPLTSCANQQTLPRKGMRSHSSSYKQRKQADMTAKVHAKALDLKLIEETSRQDLEKACKGTCPQTI